MRRLGSRPVPSNAAGSVLGAVGSGLGSTSGMAGAAGSVGGSVAGAGSVGGSLAASNGLADSVGTGSAGVVTTGVGCGTTSTGGPRSAAGGPESGGGISAVVGCSAGTEGDAVGTVGCSSPGADDSASSTALTDGRGVGAFFGGADASGPVCATVNGPRCWTPREPSPWGENVAGSWVLVTAVTTIVAPAVAVTNEGPTALAALTATSRIPYSSERRVASRSAASARTVSRHPTRLAWRRARTLAASSRRTRPRS